MYFIYSVHKTRELIGMIYFSSQKHEYAAWSGKLSVPLVLCTPQVHEKQHKYVYLRESVSADKEDMSGGEVRDLASADGNTYFCRLEGFGFRPAFLAVFSNVFLAKPL